MKVYILITIFCEKTKPQLAWQLAYSNHNRYFLIASLGLPEGLHNNRWEMTWTYGHRPHPLSRYQLSISPPLGLGWGVYKDYPFLEWAELVISACSQCLSLVWCQLSSIPKSHPSGFCNTYHLRLSKKNKRICKPSTWRVQNCQAHHL